MENQSQYDLDKTQKAVDVCSSKTINQRNLIEVVGWHKRVRTQYDKEMADPSDKMEDKSELDNMDGEDLECQQGGVIDMQDFKDDENIKQIQAVVVQVLVTLLVMSQLYYWLLKQSLHFNYMNLQSCSSKIPIGLDQAWFLYHDILYWLCELMWFIFYYIINVDLSYWSYT